MRRSLAIALLAAACGKDPGSSPPATGAASGAKHIPGGKATRFAGIEFDLPATWRTQSADGRLLVLPDGANASGVLEELYVFATDPSLKSIGGPEADRVAQEAAGAGATKTSGPDARRLGALDARAWVFSVPAQGGRTSEVRVYGFMGGSACAFVAAGLPEVLAKRASDLEAILGSLDRATTPAPGAAAPDELAGQWIRMSSSHANDGGGSQTNTWIRLEADGRYRWHHDTVSTNKNGAAWGSEDETGAWSASASSITFTPDRGGAYTQTLEKRNHPKNVNDPMIVLDGQPYVTATSRPPWR